MMKYMGIAVMALSCAAAGWFAADSLKKRLEALMTLRQMMFYLKGEILYANATLPEALENVGKRFIDGKNAGQAEPAGVFLRAASRMEEQMGEPFVVVWKEEVGRIPKEFPMKKEDRQALSSLGEHLGYADRDMQERTLLFYLEQLDDAADFLKTELYGKAKLYRSLGAAAGLFLAVIMI